MILAAASTNPDVVAELLGAIRKSARSGDTLVLCPAHVQVLLSEDVYAALTNLERGTLLQPTLQHARHAAEPHSTENQFNSIAVGRAEPTCRVGNTSQWSGPQHSIDVEELISDWLEFHVTGLVAPDRYHYSVTHLKRFFHEERRLGRLGTKIAITDLTPELQARFRAWREAAGVGGHTISRDLAALRGALSWAWKHQRIARPPFIADVPLHLRGSPLDRVLSVKEIAGIVDACVGRPDREHLIRFIVIELGTAGRPQAVLELNDKNIDFDRNLINPNQPGRTYTRKRRAIVPIAKAMRPWVIGVSGKLIKYRVPISSAQPGLGITYFERETKSIARSWKRACKEAGVSGATPKTLRHTMLTWLAERGVPSEQRRTFAGHAAQGTTARNYEHLSPTYLKQATKEVDAFFVELRKHTSAIEKPRA